MFKEYLNDKINKDNNYEEILSKIKDNNFNRRSNIFLVAVLSAAAIICIVIFSNQNMNNNNYINNDNILNSKDIIEINELDSFSETALNARIDADVKIENISLRFPFVQNIKIPSNISLKNMYALYTKNENNEYSILHDYGINYESNDYKRQIVITFSEEFIPLRCYFLNDEGMKKSKINNTEFIIRKYSDMYVTFFKYNDINFDIETSGLTENEFIEIIKSIII